MGTRGHILIIDDEPFWLESAARVLRAAGYEVHACDQWAHAAHLIMTTRPDIILLDYNMPALNGDNVCTILKRTMADLVPLVFIHSSEPEADLVQIVARCGADGYIRKSSADALTQRVDDELESARCRGVGRGLACDSC